jgi:dTDP-L-rhamnose 4-epimerase
VTVLDSFEPQVHGLERPHELPPDVSSDVRLIVGNVRDGRQLAKALEGAEALVHLAAETGTGQSMYELTKYADTNVGGTAQVIDQIIRQRPRSIQTLVLASSRAVYGEGKVQCADHGSVFPGPRLVDDLRRGEFESRCPACGAFTVALPTDEESSLAPASFYGLTKLMQEQTISMIGPEFVGSTYALRFQNVYGPGQSLINPYTGILAIFANEIRLGRPIELFEDGQSSRDFVYVEDAVEAICRCIGRSRPERLILNVGSGESSTVGNVASKLQEVLGMHVPTLVTGAFRVGDIRHAVADLRRCSATIGFDPQWSLDQGIRAFTLWLLNQPLKSSRYQDSLEEMRTQGLMQVAADTDANKTL